MGDLGGYGIADQPPKGPLIRPRARRARGRKWRPVGGNILCLRSAIPFTYAQVTHAEIAFISRNIRFLD